jgi:uncharacterized protein (TIGR02996 family)
MDTRLKSLLMNMVEHPGEDVPGLVLADWLEDRGDARAEKVRNSLATGDIYFPGYVLAGGARGGPNVVHLALQLVPQQLGVEFACGCAEHVLRIFEREFPQDRRPHQVIVTIRRWLQGEATKKEVRLVWGALLELTSENARLPSGHEDQWDQERAEAEYLAVCAGRAADQAAASVQPPARSDRWVPHVCWSTVEAASAVSTATAIGRCRNFGVEPRRLRPSPDDDPWVEEEWQRQQLLALLRSSPYA